MAENPLLNQPLPDQAVTDAAFEKAFSPEEAQRAPAAAPMPQAPQGPVNVLNPEGKLVSIPGEQLQDALSSGYTQATPEHIEAYKKAEKYGSTKDQLITALEGAGEAATFGLSTGVERGLGVKPEDIRGRREENPIAHVAGQAAGLVGSGMALPGGGAAGALERAGAGAAEAIGLGAPQTAIAKIGSSAVKAAVENSLFQAGDEVSKMLSKDPTQSVQTAVTDIGLAGLIGGGVGTAIGTVSPLWKATMGSKVGQVLKSISDRTGGIEGQAADGVNAAIQTAGLDIAPEIKAALSQDPVVQHMFQTLQESSTGSGLKAQEALKTFRKDVADHVVTTLGKTPEEVASLADMSEFDAGTQVKRALKEHLKEQIDPISEQFDNVRNRFKEVELPKEAKDEIADKIASVSQEKGYSLSASDPGTKVINDVLSEIPGLNSLEDLRKYQSLIQNKVQEKQLWALGNDLRNIFRSAEERLLDKTLGEQAPELLESHAAARAAYKRAMTTVDELNDRLHVGKFSGPASFAKALDEMAPEDILRRLSPKNDAGVIGILNEKFPLAAKQLQDYQLSQVLKGAARQAMPGETISTKVLFTNLEKLSPEMRSFIMGPEAQAKLGAIQELIERLPSKMNTSGTAKTLDSLWEHIPATATGLVTMLAGHNPLTAVLVSGLTKILGRDVPDAIRLGLLKFLGSGQAIESEGFKAMVDFIQATIKGENLTAKAAKNLFKAGQEVLPQSQIPSAKDREKLDKQLKSLQKDQKPLLEVGGKTGHYLPDHGTALGQTTANAVNYLNSLRPSEDKRAPLDSKPTVSKVDKASYEQALTIAQQPLVVLDKIKQGTVTPQDVQHLRTMYPELYNRLAEKLTSNMVNAVEKGETIPYKTRIGLSLFLGQTLDSTLSPQAILAAQPKPVPSTQQQTPKEGGNHSLKALNKLPGAYQTPTQARDAEKAQGK